ELEKFFHLFMSASDSPEQLAEAIASASLEHIDLMAASDVAADDLFHRLEEQMERTGGRGNSGGDGADGDGDGHGDGSGNGLARERGRARQVFSRAVAGTRRIVHHAMKTGRPDLRFAKRLVQPVVDNI